MLLIGSGELKGGCFKMNKKLGKGVVVVCAENFHKKIGVVVRRKEMELLFKF